MSDDKQKVQIVEAMVCPQCSALNYMEANFCSYCGEKFSQDDEENNSNFTDFSEDLSVDSQEKSKVVEAVSQEQSKPATSAPGAPVFPGCSVSEEPSPLSPLGSSLPVFTNAGIINGQSSVSSDGVDQDFLTLLGRNKSEYYLEKFAIMDISESDISWNWAAFFGGIFWGCYRRLYKQVGFTILAGIVVVMVPELMLFINIGLMAAWGMFGTSWYKDALEEKAKLSKSMAEPMKTRYLQSNSGPLF